MLKYKLSDSNYIKYKIYNYTTVIIIMGKTTKFVYILFNLTAILPNMYFNQYKSM